MAEAEQGTSTCQGLSVTGATVWFYVGTSFLWLLATGCGAWAHVPAAARPATDMLVSVEVIGPENAQASEHKDHSCNHDEQSSLHLTG